MRITHDRVERAQFANDDWWLIHGIRTEDDGTERPWCHRLPVWSLEQRAAEYGIDPTDLSTLLDVVLWEPYLGELDDGHGDDHPDFLWNAETIERARTVHLERITAVKKRLAHPDQHDHNPALDPIRVDHGIDHRIVALKAEHFGIHREAHRRRRAEQATAQPPDRHAEWTTRLAATKEREARRVQ
jgi:hypothetical protein